MRQKRRTRRFRNPRLTFSRTNRFRRLLLESLEDRRVLSASYVPELPGMQLVDPRPSQFEGQLIHLDFDGAQSVQYNGPVTVGPFDVPAFAVPESLAAQEEDIQSHILMQLNHIFGGVGVTFTADQLPDENEFSTIYIGGDSSAFAPYGTFDGLAEAVDIGNHSRSDNAIVFAGNFLSSRIDLESYSTLLVSVIAHETGHLLGYVHDSESTSASTTTLDSVAYSPAVHFYLTGQGFAFFKQQFEGADISNAVKKDEPFAAFYLKNGARNEDVGKPNEDDVGKWIPLNPWNEDESFPYLNYPTYRHFWDHSTDVVNNAFKRLPADGLAGYDSAPNRAYKYFSGGIGLDKKEEDPDWTKNKSYEWEEDLKKGIKWLYANASLTNNYKAAAFDWLGHVAHLLQDMTVPAHVHADAHGSVGRIFGAPKDCSLIPMKKCIFQAMTTIKTGGLNLQANTAAPAAISAPHTTWPNAQYDPLYELFKEVATNAEYYDSDDVDGRGWQGAAQQGNWLSADKTISDKNCYTIANAMLPMAIRSTAELIRYFYHEVDSTGPTVKLSGISTDENNPTHLSSTYFHVLASASDDKSGVDKDGDRFYVADWTGSSWTSSAK